MTLALLFVVILLLVEKGIITYSTPDTSQYPVKGVDVSSYQGDIDWQLLANQNIQFAFIKATEGSSHVDPTFSYNYREANKTGLRVGAYHFFSFDSPARTQAQNYIVNVYKTKTMLPPVIDIELYGDKAKHHPDPATTKAALKELCDAFEEAYGMKPILYVTERSYGLYIKDDFKIYDIWIRNTIKQPVLDSDQNWTFWQYTNKARLPGYKGIEHRIDMNVFHGSAEQFKSYPSP